jgi:hypothetical protein
MINNKERQFLQLFLAGSMKRSAADKPQKNSSNCSSKNSAAHGGHEKCSSKNSAAHGGHEKCSSKNGAQRTPVKADRSPLSNTSASMFPVGM